MEQKFKNNYLWGKCKTRKKLSLEADRNESGGGNIEQGDGRLKTGNIKSNIKGGGVMGHEWNVMNGVSETLFEQKKQKRVLPNWMLEVKRSEPKDTEKNNSSPARAPIFPITPI